MTQPTGAGPVLNCPGCGAPVRAAAHFCGGCGATLYAQCPGCGQPSRHGDAFCGHCGAAMADAPLVVGTPVQGRQVTTRPVRRSPLPRLAAAGGVLLALVVLAGGAWALLRSGGGDDDGGGDTQPAEPLQSTATVLEPVAADAVDPVLGLPLRPHVRLDHPDGARADIPGGSALYGDVMDLRRVDLAEDRLWDHGGTGWEFVSFVGVPIEGEAVIDLPAGAAGSVPLVRTAIGLWLELPFEPVTLAGGEGVRVRVTNVPAPWVFALATPRPHAPALTADDLDALRLEQLYWTDRAAWEAEVLDWLATEELTAHVQQPLLAFQDPSPAETYDRIRGQLRYTTKMFAAARAGLTGDLTIAPAVPLPGLALSSTAVWGAAVQRLYAVQQNWLEFRASLGDLSVQGPNFRVAIYFVDEWIETAMHDYTPWGIDFVKTLLDTGGLKGFDIRVLKPYGELKWIDVQIDAGDMPAIDEAVNDVLAAETVAPIAGTPNIHRVMRLYSVRAMERLAVVDWLKENVDWIVRWLPVGLAAVGLIPGAVGLSFAFAAADQILSWVQDWYTAGDASPYAFLNFEAASAGGLGGTSFLMDMWEEKVLMSREARPMLASHGLTIAQFAYSVGMYTAVRGTDWYLFKTLREINAGTRGYCAWSVCDEITGAIPPVMVHVRATGLLARDPGDYPTGVDRMMAYRLETGAMDYHTGWLQGHRTPNGALADLGFNEYGRKGWPLVVQRTAPEYQAIRLAIPKAAIPPEVWGDRPADTALSEFGAYVTLEAPSQSSVTIDLTAPATKLPTDRADTFYATVRVRDKDAKGVGGLTLYTFEDGYDAPEAHEGTMAGSQQPQMLLKGTVGFADDRIEPLTFDLDFSKLPMRQALLTDLLSDEPILTSNDQWVRVQYAAVTLQQEIFGNYQLTSWQFLGGSPELVQIYMNGDLYYTGRNCEMDPAGCTFSVTQSPARGADPAYIRAMVCGPGDGTTSTCIALADSRSWAAQHTDSTGLPPTAHDNFVQIAGPILTGSDDVNSSWNPGEVVTINHWNEVHAEFDGDRVTGTITTGQVVWDVVNGQKANIREIAVKVAFEAKRVK
ncbi:MAG: zinc ribbon domain-containing protein [Dehalococcoidia bacterium]|nr:zinc ribbon domain-containing protein [Dehalococcoidia bacterium]